MIHLPRLALGTFQPNADGRPLLGALLGLLEQEGVQTQVFASRAELDARDVAAVMTGLCQRHLDSWLMSPDICRELFQQGASGSDLALIVGQFAQLGGAVRPGGSLEALCNWLNLPRLLVVDVQRLRTCCLPRLPADVDGLLLDRVRHADDIVRWQTMLEALWRVPVLGGLCDGPARQAASRLPTDGDSSGACYRRLADQLGRSLQRERLRQLAASRPLVGATTQLFRRGAGNRRPNIALAYDEAFHHYFTDTLDLLERQGAVLRDFSPLRDEALPPGTDLVFIGCGEPEKLAASLAANHCIKQALRWHARAGGRVYGEGAGLAYLCRALVDAEGRSWPMTGLLPASARRESSPAATQPVELTLSRASWLGPSGGRVRGYLSHRWQLRAADRAAVCGWSAPGQAALLDQQQVLGSRLQLHFASQPQLLSRLLVPTAARRPLPTVL